VEYKRGKPKQSRCDEVQICAQAFCLEEMLGVAIGEGALFYGRTRRRTRVVFDGALRRRTVQAAERFHDLFREGQTPRAVREPKCDDCSLLSVCIPDAQGQSAERYLFRLFEEGS
jgi:CRISPR-associated exonuclease Cas4